MEKRPVAMAEHVSCAWTSSGSLLSDYWYYSMHSTLGSCPRGSSYLGPIPLCSMLVFVIHCCTNHRRRHAKILTEDNGPASGQLNKGVEESKHENIMVVKHLNSPEPRELHEGIEGSNHAIEADNSKNG